METPFHFEALLPPEIAIRAENAGVRKAALGASRTFLLAVLAGAFIGLGAAFSTTVAAGATIDTPFGWNRLLAGLAFSSGLILVILGGAELFTGNNLLVMAWASGRLSTARLMRNWAIVYAGNFAGAVATAAAVFAGAQYTFGGGAVGVSALSIAAAKCRLDFFQAFSLGVLCNALVCLAVWLSYSGRTAADKILGIAPPIAAFVAIGFEHSIANMYFIPLAMLVRTFAPESFWRMIGQDAAAYPELTLQRFLFGNLLPVTLGNIVGGTILVGIVYWFVYLKGAEKRSG